MKVIELIDVGFSLLAIGMAIYGLLEIGTYIDRIERFAREIRLIETSANAQIDALRKRIERLRFFKEEP